MADRPAAIHWQIARGINGYARSGNSDVDAVYMAANEYRNFTLQPEDINKISTVLDKISMRQAGYWHGFLSRYLS